MFSQVGAHLLGVEHGPSLQKLTTAVISQLGEAYPTFLKTHLHSRSRKRSQGCSKTLRHRYLCGEIMVENYCVSRQFANMHKFPLFYGNDVPAPTVVSRPLFPCPHKNGLGMRLVSYKLTLVQCTCLRCTLTELQ